jgi:hypothetical protein
MESNHLTHKSIQGIDASVDGLFAGLLAGTIMLIALVVMGAVQGVGLVEVLSRFAINEPRTALSGLLLHLAVSGVYGMAFGLAWAILQRWFRAGVASWISLPVGLVYGLLLAVIAQTWILPNTAGGLGELPLYQFFGAHLIYGICLGWYFQRKSRYLEGEG